MADSTSPAKALGQAQPDDPIVRAMNRVLECEQEAEAAVAECARQCDQLLERSRARRLAMLERARARMVGLHARAAKALERRMTELTEQHRQATVAGIAQLSDPNARNAALQRLTVRLTGSAADRDEG